jgi:osmotically inducible protein OsmC
MMKIKRSASVRWTGGLKEGRGEISTQTGALSAYPYGFASRFEGTPGSNPEELIGAAHASCFTMAFTLILSKAGFTPAQLDTQAVVALEQQGDAFVIPSIALTLKAAIPGIDEATFMELATLAKLNCPVSKVLNAEITLHAELV